ncbi:MAG TPA: helix-hairpin-helix domain-containing protein [Gemmatimonadales bacterium]|nr:helix-hairpin-helix domain-containing protein [Gemmatimonadales bacterium]
MPAKHRVSSDPLQVIPGVGPSIARDLRQLGVRRVADLKGKSPERLYARLGEIRGVRQDPCLLYTFRCAVYFATTSRPSAERLKWWRWKDPKASA